MTLFRPVFPIKLKIKDLILDLIHSSLESLASKITLKITYMSRDQTLNLEVSKCNSNVAQLIFGVIYDPRKTFLRQIISKKDLVN